MKVIGEWERVDLVVAVLALKAYTSLVASAKLRPPWIWTREFNTWTLTRSVHEGLSIAPRETYRQQTIGVQLADDNRGNAPIELLLIHHEQNESNSSDCGATETSLDDQADQPRQHG